MISVISNIIEVCHRFSLKKGSRRRKKGTKKREREGYLGFFGNNLEILICLVDLGEETKTSPFCFNFLILAVGMLIGNVASPKTFLAQILAPEILVEDLDPKLSAHLVLVAYLDFGLLLLMPASVGI